MESFSWESVAGPEGNATTSLSTKSVVVDSVDVGSGSSTTTGITFSIPGVDDAACHTSPNFCNELPSPCAPVADAYIVVSITKSPFFNTRNSPSLLNENVLSKSVPVKPLLSARNAVLSFPITAYPAGSSEGLPCFRVSP